MMRRQIRSAAISLTLVSLASFAAGISLSAPPPAAAGKSKPASTSGGANAQAALLVDQALEAEAAGNLSRRDALLAEAIKTAPHYARAHWAAHQVRSGSIWLPVPQAEAAAAESPKLSQYRDMKDKFSGTPAGEEEIAIWCENRGLGEESKWHWHNVLEHDPQHHRALKALGLHYHNGYAVSAADRTRAIHEAEKFNHAYEKWKPKLMHLRHAISGKDDGKRQDAIAKIHEIADPEVVPVFELLLQDKSPENDSETFSLEMVRTFRNLSDRTFTSALVRQAVLADWQATRQEAVAALAEREFVSYVPDVLGLMHLPIERTFSITTDYDGHIHYEQKLCRPGPDANDVQINRTMYWLHHWPLLNALRNPPLPSFRAWSAPGIVPITYATMQDQQRGFQMVARQSDLDHQAVDKQNEDAVFYNINAIELLKANGKVDRGDKVEDWWDWWSEYNELDKTVAHPDRYAYSNRIRDAYIPCCFGAGTKVSTLTGLVPIEQIVAGDRVLAQDPQTGELGYKLVLATSTRKPSPLRKLTIGDETILTTRGHRFWQIGRGWQMSKQLESGALLYSNAAPVAIEAVEDADDEEAYNLTVADFHSYFVGEHRLLVHDNTAPKQVLGAVPGLKPDSKQ